MRNLIFLFTRFGHVLLFLVFQLICFYLIISFNTSQKDIWLNSINIFSGKLNNRVQNFSDYTRLRELNDSLKSENALLLEKVLNFRLYNESNDFESFEGDSSLYQYSLVPVKICNKTTHLRNNYFSLCQGTDDGLRSRMGIITEKGVVGITSKCSRNFCKSLFILNSLARVNAQIKRKNYVGSIQWESADPRILTMYSVPKFANIEIGDTVETSGYSTVFPEGVPIGTVSNIDVLEGENEYILELITFENLNTIENAFAIDYKYWEEKDSLVETTIYE